MRFWIILAFAALAATLTANARPQRIVTTNVCADQLALALAERQHIISVSRLATQPEISNFAEAAQGIPVNNARAEEIVMLKPDLILGDIYTGNHANNWAKAIGVPVHVINAGASIDDVRAIIREAAKALAEEARGTTLIDEMDARITKVRQLHTAPITALVYEPNGLTSGSGTLADDILSKAGLINMAPQLTASAYATVPLEQIVSTAPQLLILDDSYSSSSSRAQSILRHPAFLSLKGRTAIYRIPSRLWLCPGPWIAEAVEHLAAQRARFTPG